MGFPGANKAKEGLRHLNKEMKYDVWLTCKPEILEEEIFNDADQEFYVSKKDLEKTGLVTVLVNDVPYEAVTDEDCMRLENFCKHFGLNEELWRSLIVKIKVDGMDDDEEDDSDDEYAPDFY